MNMLAEQDRLFEVAVYNLIHSQTTDVAGVLVAILSVLLLIYALIRHRGRIRGLILTSVLLSVVSAALIAANTKDHARAALICAIVKTGTTLETLEFDDNSNGESTIRCVWQALPQVRYISVTITREQADKIRNLVNAPERK